MKSSTTTPDIQSALIDDPDFLKAIAANFLQNLIDKEFTEKLGASSYQRSAIRKGYRNGYYERSLKTRVGRIELTVPRDREGVFRTELFERYQRNEKAFVLALAEMYMSGVSTRKVSEVVETLCGESISKSQVSELSKSLDKNLEEWRHRPLTSNYAYMLVDAIYEKVREGGRVSSVATFIAVGINREGYREVIGCQVATSEYKTEWKEFLRSLKTRGMNQPELVCSDDHEGLRQAIVEEFTGALWQRCQVHYMRNFSGKLSHKHKSKILPLLQNVLHAPDYDSALIAKGVLVQELLDKGLENIAEWIEESIDDAMNVLNIPEGHRKRMRSTNMLERVNEEVRRRTRVIRIFPNRAACIRVITSICQERSESWEGRIYLSFEGVE